MGTTLNQSKQNFRCIGLVNELNLTREDCEIKVKDKNGNDDGTRNGERIRGKVSIRLENNFIKTFDVFFNSLNSRGEENKQWKNAEAMLELNPEIDGDREREPSLVVVDGRVAQNDYKGTDNLIHSNLRWNVSRISTSRITEDDTKACTLSGNFFIKNIREETKDDENTGRLLVTLIGVDYGASPIIVETVVEEDLADDFSDLYEVGQTANFDIDVTAEHIGEKITGKKKFGTGGAIAVNNGYDKETLVIVGGDEPIEEPEDEDEDGNIIDNGWIDPKAMKIALKERENKLEELKESDNTSKTEKASLSSLKKAKSANKTTTKKKIEIEDFDDDEDDDSPFDLDDLDDEDF